MNIILFVSDTFRRDHLPCYGNSRVIAPNFESFAQRSLVLDDCYPVSFPTVPARADLLTGRYTFLYQNWGPLAQTEITLPQCLSRAGYRTMGVVDTPFLSRNGYGQDRGFQDFIFIRGQRGGAEHADVRLLMRQEEDWFAPQTLKTAAEWLERHYQERFFLYIDTWDPHEPWDPPSYYVKPYFPDYAGEIIHPAYWEYQADGVSERDLAIAHACYCGEITMIDRWFGFLLERIRTLGIQEDTILLFTSDHGFYFGEHGLFGKRRFRSWNKMPHHLVYQSAGQGRGGFIYRSPLHNEITQIPLLIYLPGEQSRRVKGLVTLPDLMPTILELAGVETPPTVQAKSCLPLIRGQVDKIHDLVVTGNPIEEIGSVTGTVDDVRREARELSPCSITDGEWDLLYAGQGQPVELYRTREDPGHNKNLFEQNREVAESLRTQFETWLEQNDAPPGVLEARRRF